MKMYRKARERGQAMILLVFMIIALVAIIGLAIDGGRLHSDRRQAQNAADSAALAGAQKLLQFRVDACETGSMDLTALDDAVGGAVRDYARQNGVKNDGTTGEVRAWYVDPNANNVCRAGVHALTHAALNNITGVRVSLNVTETTTFMRVVGQNEMTTVGNATAMVGPVVNLPAMGPVLPYAVPDEVIYDMQPGDDFAVNNDGAVCKADNPNDCSEDMADAEANSQRGWLNFDYIYNYEHHDRSDPYWRTKKSTFNAAGLKDYVNNPETVPTIFPGTPPNPWPVTDPDTTTYYGDGDYIVGEGGQKQSVMNEIYDNYGGESAYAPIFDLVYGTDDLIDAPDDDYPPPDDLNGDDHWPSNFNKNTYFYHIIGFVKIEVDETGGKELSGTFQKAIIGQAQIDPTQIVTCDLRMVGVTLWE